MDIETKNVNKFNEDFIGYVKQKYPQILNTILETGELTTKIEKLIKEAVVKFKEEHKAILH